MDLANTLREERKTAELQRLDKRFYEQVGLHLASLELELSKIEDPYSVDAQIVHDTLKSERNSVNKLIDQRMKKIVRRVMKNASSEAKDEAFSDMTLEEEDIYNQMLSAILTGRETIQARLSRTERALTGKKDIGQEYRIVRLLDSVPMFIGIDGRNYLLSKDDVVVLPAIHARNLCNKDLATEIKKEG